MNSFVISIKTNRVRRKHIEDTFAAAKVPFRFFDAYSSENSIVQAAEALLPNLLHSSRLSTAEKGCFLSHLALWQQCIDNSLSYIGIFEDDVILGENADKFLAEDQWIRERFAHGAPWIIHLETYLDNVKVRKTSSFPSHAGRDFHRMSGNHVGAAAYLISRPAAQILLHNLRRYPPEKILPLDFIFNEDLKPCSFAAYQLIPALAVQEDRYQQQSVLHSQIAEQRAQLRQTHPYKMRLSPAQKLKRALKKPLRLLADSKPQVIPFQ